MKELQGLMEIGEIYIYIVRSSQVSLGNLSISFRWDYSSILCFAVSLIHKYKREQSFCISIVFVLNKTLKTIKYFIYQHAM